MCPRSRPTAVPLRATRHRHGHDAELQPGPRRRSGARQDRGQRASAARHRQVGQRIDCLPVEQHGEENVRAEVTPVRATCPSGSPATTVLLPSAMAGTRLPRWAYSVTSPPGCCRCTVTPPKPCRLTTNTVPAAAACTRAPAAPAGRCRCGTPPAHAAPRRAASRTAKTRRPAPPAAAWRAARPRRTTGPNPTHPAPSPEPRGACPALTSMPVQQAFGGW